MVDLRMVGLMVAIGELEPKFRCHIDVDDRIRFAFNDVEILVESDTAGHSRFIMDSSRSIHVLKYESGNLDSMITVLNTAYAIIKSDCMIEDEE